MKTQEIVQAPGPHLESQTTPVLLSPKASCLRQGWTWREYESLAWCESYRLCGQAIPECPGGNKHWANIRESSRLCETTSVKGYRVYCHVSDREAKGGDL